MAAISSAFTSVLYTYIDGQVQYPLGSPQGRVLAPEPTEFRYARRSAPGDAGGGHSSVFGGPQRIFWALERNQERDMRAVHWVELRDDIRAVYWIVLRGDIRAVY